MKKHLTLWLLIFFLFLSASCTAAEQIAEPVDKTPESPTVVPENTVAEQLNSDLQAVYECALVGSWHAAPGFPAGYTQRYIFYTNYNFVFLKSQMDTANPLISYWGTWKIEDDQLSLTVLHKRMIIGGEIVDDPTFGDTLEGGNIETIDLDPPVELTYTLPSFEIDNVYFSSHENEISYRITIGEEDYWKVDTFNDFDEKQEFYNPLW